MRNLVEAPGQIVRGVVRTVRGLPQDVEAGRDLLFSPLIPDQRARGVIRREAVKGLCDRHPWIMGGEGKVDQ